VVVGMDRPSGCKKGTQKEVHSSHQQQKEERERGEGVGSGRHVMPHSARQLLFSRRVLLEESEEGEERGRSFFFFLRRAGREHHTQKPRNALHIYV
jgi:hypothetical protein